MWSQICEKMSECVKKNALTKMFYVFFLYFFAFSLQGNFMDSHSNFTTNLRQHFQNSFS